MRTGVRGNAQIAANPVSVSACVWRNGCNRVLGSILAMAVGTPSPGIPAATLRYRRRVGSLSPGQLAILRRAFAAVLGISDERGYQYHAGIHGLPLPIGCDNAHGTPYFLPWHRAYLYFFERALRDQVRDAMLTWWDWRTVQLGADPGLPAAFRQRTTGDGPNPLFSVSINRVALEQGRRQGMAVPARTRRAPGKGPVSLPTRDEVAAVLKLHDFLDFTEQLEDLHNRVHVWVGGHMGMIPFAAYDPIFWAHHTMIDRIWRLWQLRHPNALPPAAILDQALPPFRMTVRQTLDVTALGYDYAESTRSVTAT
jgi:tyrosinase